ncbi:DNA-binding anti-repressor SinI [Brevibacillus choshinensis]|uniref:Anti-repressor SinI family protein n=1 Tax=Brevibacillus choshinensis TaxID=54911 RepID=A0ABX7FJ34_BRECH|nr:DNA-binding anti-repressor SinI [Brevibacillus choshinensis]QRG66241.1 anti-repressor SinI family protein [Brevibacillus choshinensis]
MFAKEIGIEEMDEEWKKLIEEAKMLGITKEEIQDFLLMATKRTTGQR